MKHIPKVLLVIVLLVLAAQCHSQTLLTEFVSKHSRDGFNDQNTGIGLRIDEGKLSGWAAGYYRNSIEKDSFYVAREWQWQVAGPVHVGVLVGAVTGYEWSVTPLALPQLVAHIGRSEVALLVQPFDVSDRLPAFVSLQYRFKF